MKLSESPLSVLSGAPLRILVVDDYRDFAETTVLILSTAGHTVQSAQNGQAALVIADQFQPHLVLLDLRMPGMTGYEVANRLRQAPLGERPILVAVTGYGQVVDRMRTRAAGFSDHLLKPVKIEDFARVLALVPSWTPACVPAEATAR